MVSHKLLFIYGFLNSKGREKYSYPDLKREEAVRKRTEDAKNIYDFKELVDEEQRELHQGKESGTGYPKSHYSNRLIYENYSMNLESMYYWILTQLQVDQGFRKDQIFKITDIFSASEMSAYWGISSQRLGIQQDKASQFLRTIAEMVRSMFQIVRDLGVVDEKLGYYESSFSDDEGEAEDGEMVLKGQFVDLVEGGSQNPTSVIGMAQKAGFSVLPDLFFKTRIKGKTEEEIIKKIRGKVQGLEWGNVQIKNILEQKLSQYYRWKYRTYKQLILNRKMFKSYLRQHFNTIRLYMQWIKPYLKNIKRLHTNQGMTESPNLVAAFEGNMIEIEVLAAKPAGKKYSSCVLANFQYRTVPHLDYDPKYGQQRASMTGRAEMNLKAYGWTKDELENYKAMKEAEDLELLKDIETGLQEGMDAMNEAVMKYLNEEKEEEKREEKKSKPKPIKVGEFFEPFTEVAKGFGSVFSPLIPEIKSKAPKGSEKATDAAGKAAKSAWNLYKYYKKAHRLLAW